MIDVITLHWSLHPEKDQTWYEAECERRGDPDAVARELDIKYLAGDSSSIVFADSFRLNRNVESNTFKKFATSCKTIYRVWDIGQYPAVLFFFKHEGISYLFEEFVPEDKPNTYRLAERILEHCKQPKYNGYIFQDIADIAVKQGKNSQKELPIHQSDLGILSMEYGIYPLMDLVHVRPSITKVQGMFKRGELIIDSSCIKSIDAVTQGYCWDRPLGKELERNPKQVHPYEDIVDCIRYYVHQHYKPQELPGQVKAKVVTPDFFSKSRKRRHF
jgi:hypothetical protein